MSELTRLGKNNPLWRRVQRHAQMSAIFAPRPTAVSYPTHYAPAAEIAAPNPTDLPDLPTAVSPAPTPAAAAQPNPAVPVQPGIQRINSPPTAVPQPTAPTPASPVPTAAPEDKVKEDDANWRRLQTIVQRHRQKQAAESAAPAAPVQRQAATPEPQPPTAVPQKITTSEETAVPDEPPTVQPVPLEAAWPVQKSGAPSPDSPSTPNAPPPIPPTVQRQELPSDDAAQIDQNLARVAPGRRTGSPIETILPSRPRPQPRAQSIVQRREQPQAAGEPPEPVARPEAAAAPPPQTADPPTPPPTLIQTEIGPLPADLWETLGETPPITTPPTAERVPPPALANLPPEPPQQSSVARREAPVAAPDPETLDDLPQPAKPAQTAAPAAEAIPAPPPTKTIVTRPVTPAAKAVQRRPAETAAAPPPSSTTETAIQRQPLEATTVHFATQTAVPAAEAAPIQPPPNLDAPRSMMPVAKAAVQHQPAETVITPPDPVSPLTAVPVPTPIQRTPETAVQRFPALPEAQQMVNTLSTAAGLSGMTPDLATAVAPANPPTEAEQPAPQELDIDALSRQVYQALKRKLAVEWERGYGR